MRYLGSAGYNLEGPKKYPLRPQVLFRSRTALVPISVSAGRSPAMRPCVSPPPVTRSGSRGAGRGAQVWGGPN